MENKYKNLENYCKRLGHHITFSYCLAEKNNLPCGQILNCWYEKIPIEDYIRDNYSPEKQAVIFSPASEKITDLVALINKVKENNKSS